MLPIRDINRPVRKPVVTRMLIIVNILIFIFTYFRPNLEFQYIIWILGTKPKFLLNGLELYTLVTSMFLHGDIHHIFGNMLYLWIFGDNVEDRMGHKNFLLFYLIAGITASIVQSLLTPDSIVPMIGASGAISGVLGAYFILFPWARILTIFFGFMIWLVEIPAYYYLGFWFILQLLYGFISLGGYKIPIAFWAHIGGFIFGLIIAAIFKERLERKYYKETYIIWV